MISLIDDGTGGAIRAHEIDLNAITIDGNADIFADIIRFSTSSSMTLGKLTATDEISLFAGDELATGDLTSRKIDLEGTEPQLRRRQSRRVRFLGRRLRHRREYQCHDPSERRC